MIELQDRHNDAAEVLKRNFELFESQWRWSDFHLEAKLTQPAEPELLLEPHPLYVHVSAQRLRKQGIEPNAAGVTKLIRD